MGSFAPSESSLNTFLTMHGVGFRPRGLVGNGIAPRISVPAQFGSVITYDRDSWLRQPSSTLKAPGQSPAGGLFTASTTSFYCVGRQWGETMAVEVVDGSDPIGMLERSAERVLDVLAIDQEQRLVAAAFAGVASSMVLTGTSAWTSTTSSAVTANAATARESILATTGIAPNTVVCPQKVYDSLIGNNDVVRHGVGNSAHERLASVFQVEPSRLYVPTAVVGVTHEGQTASYSSVWSTCVLVCFVPDAPGANTPSFMYQLWWSGPHVTGTAPDGAWTVKATPDREAGTYRTYARGYSAEQVVAPSLGYTIVTGI